MRFHKSNFGANEGVKIPTTGIRQIIREEVKLFLLEDSSSEMTQEEADEVLERCEIEGSSSYTFVNYSSFEEIKDRKFHDLVDKFVKIHNELEQYLLSHGSGRYSEMG